MNEKLADAETVSHQLEPVVSALRHHLGPNLVAIVLFGSRARGDHRPDSDWDLLVIADRLPQKPFQRHLYLKRLLPLMWRGQVSVLAKTPAELEANLTSLLLDVALDGIILYDTDAYIARRLAHVQHLLAEKGLYRVQVGRDLTWQWREFPGRDWSIEWEMRDELFAETDARQALSMAEEAVTLAQAIVRDNP
jgi:predicted nucleotidyltransferase